MGIQFVVSSLSFLLLDKNYMLSKNKQTHKFIQYNYWVTGQYSDYWEQNDKQKRRSTYPHEAQTLINALFVKSKAMKLHGWAMIPEMNI